jgi:hypothetical protein
LSCGHECPSNCHSRTTPHGICKRCKNIFS